MYAQIVTFALQNIWSSGVAYISLLVYGRIWWKTSLFLSDPFSFRDCDMFLM